MPKKNVKKTSKFINQPFDFTLCIVIILLLALGIIMLLSASSPSAFAETGDSYAYVRRQIAFAVVGVILMIILSKIDYRFYKKFYKIAYVISIILLVLVLIAGEEAGGAKRWINIGFSFQPSEVVKIALIIFYAGWLTKNKDELSKFGKGFLKHLLPLIPIAGLLMLQPHFSTTMVIVGICSIMMIMAGCKFKHFLLSGITVGIPGIVALIMFTDYRLQRVITFLNPWADKQDTGWQVIQSLYAIGSGGLFGAGLRRKQTKIFIFTRST